MIIASIIESLKNDPDHQFNSIAVPIIEKLIKEANQFLSKYDLSVIYDSDYEFDNNSEWVAAINFEDQADAHEFLVAFNLRYLYDFLKSEGTDDDLEEIEVQLKVSLYHEIAHGIIDFFSDELPFRYNDEKICEEFGKYFIKEYSGQNRSKLMNELKKLKK